jgi:protein ImuA
MTASRRLQLAAEKTGTIGFAVRRWRRQTEASDFGQPTASTSRWRVSVLPSEELPVPGVGRPRWLLELMRVKAGECAEFIVGACDATGRIHLSSAAGDRADQAGGWSRRAVG